MRFVHSLWPSPSLNERWGFDAKTAIITNIWYYSLSVAYLKKLGQKIVLHTDNFGQECLNHIPYDEIYLTIENEVPKDICPIMWACSKFYALKNEPLESIHIDGDVFIKSQKCLDMINAGSFDLFCQGKKILISGKNKYLILFTKIMMLIYNTWISPKELKNMEQMPIIQE